MNYRRIFAHVQFWNKLYYLFNFTNFIWVLNNKKFHYVEALILWGPGLNQALDLGIIYRTQSVKGSQVHIYKLTYKCSAIYYYHLCSTTFARVKRRRAENKAAVKKHAHARVKNMRTRRKNVKGTSRKREVWLWNRKRRFSFKNNYFYTLFI